MKEFKGTRGPWTGKDIFRGVVLSGEGLSLSCGFASEEAKANGKLALAAPDLLEALQQLLEDVYSNNDSVLGYRVDEAHAAISKALGEG